MEMHVHTNPASSDSMLDPHDLVRIAQEDGLTGVNLTEHDKVLEPHHPRELQEEHEDFFVNFGMEVSTDLGHMLAIGLREYLPGIRRAEKLREELDAVGGFLIVAHPFRRLFDPVTAMRTGETFDLTAEQAAEMPVFEIVHGIEILNGANTVKENEFAAEVATIRGVAGTGGSDAHSTSGVGQFTTAFERKITSPEELLEELHAGRYEAVHRLKSGRRVRFELGSLEAAESEATG
jgi:predicted metal-dependent phosphoesterase TrpH